MSTPSVRERDQETSDYDCEEIVNDSQSPEISRVNISPQKKPNAGSELRSGMIEMNEDQSEILPV